MVRSKSIRENIANKFQVISLNFRVMTGELDDAIGHVSVCIFWHEQGNFGNRYGK